MITPHVDALPGTSEPPSRAPFLARVPPDYPATPLQPILPGMYLWVMNVPENPRDVHNPIWQLVRIKGNVWEFKCACNKDECTRTMRMTPKYHGRCPRREG